MKKVAILLTVYNRRLVTLRCLNNLKKILNSVQDKKFDIYLTEDGCTDGTPNEVNMRFPDITIISGNGKLFWSGGMRAAWRKASQVGDYDYYLWLNDDVLLYEHSLKEVFELSEKLDNKVLICGAFENNEHLFTYGGRDKCTNPVIPNGEIQDIYLTNGNLLLVPRIIFKSLGNISDYFIHDMGDIDYGLRALEHKFRVITTLSYVGECQDNPLNIAGKGHKLGTTWYNRLKYLYSPRGVNPNIVFRFNLYHYGLYKAIRGYIGAIYYTLLPDNIYLKGKKDNENTTN